MVLRTPTRNLRTGKAGKENPEYFVNALGVTEKRFPERSIIRAIAECECGDSPRVQSGPCGIFLKCYCGKISKPAKVLNEAVKTWNEKDYENRES